MFKYLLFSIIDRFYVLSRFLLNIVIKVLSFGALAFFVTSYYSVGLTEGFWSYMTPLGYVIGSWIVREVLDHLYIQRLAALRN